MADVNRKTAYETLLEIERNQAYSNIELNHQIGRLQPDNPAFVRELVYGVLENQIYIDYILRHLIPNGLKGVKKPVRVLLRMGLYQLIFMDSVPEYAAVNETVRLAGKVAPGRNGFINGVLRGYERKKEQITLPDPQKDMISYLSVKYSFDPSIIKLWISQYTVEETEEILAGSNRRPPLSIRINLMKTTEDDLVKELTAQGFELTKSQLCERTFFVKGSGLLETDAFEKGWFSVQDTASVLAVDMLAPEPGDVVMDICAAPGGKTLAMGEKMKNQGRILAFDVYAHKLDLMQKEAKRLGISIIETGEQDGTVLHKAYIQFADKVLVDGPCSGLGVLRRKPEIKLRPVLEDAASLTTKQSMILENACQYVKEGGFLLYSTCTINKKENGELTKVFLAHHTEYEMIEERQLLPCIDDTDGFYICKMRRKAMKGER